MQQVAPLQDTEIQEKLAKLSTVFTPRTPVQDKRIFAGRIIQLAACLSLTDQPGMHGILYGERGVGKTSLSNIVQLLLDGEHMRAIKKSCDSSDTIETLWRKIFREIVVPVQSSPGDSMGAGKIGFGANIEREHAEQTLDTLIPELCSLALLLRVPFLTTPKTDFAR